MKAVSSAPAMITTVALAAAACVIAFGHLNAANAAFVTSLAVAAGTVVMLIAGALNGKPVSMQALTGAVTIIFADLTLFGVHMNPDERGALAAAVGVAAGVIFHLLHVTVSADPAATAISPRSVPGVVLAGEARGWPEES